MNVGNRVKLRSGGPLMTVVAVGDKTLLHAGEFKCRWFDMDGAMNTEWFAAATLTLYPEIETK